MKPADLELLRTMAQKAALETEKAIAKGLSHVTLAGPRKVVVDGATVDETASTCGCSVDEHRGSKINISIVGWCVEPFRATVPRELVLL